MVDFFVPSDFGDPRFAELINGRWSPGGGTMCTYLPAQLLFLLGCRDDRTVNFDDPEGATRFEIGAGSRRS